MNVTGTVREKAEAEEGWIITVDIPSFKSKFPTKLNRVPTEEAAGMVVGQTYIFDLEKGNPKAGKTADSTTAWDFWWNYKGFSPLVASDAKTELVGAKEPVPQIAQVDEKGHSIERQTALKVAGELYAALLQAPPESAFDFEEIRLLARRLVARFFQEDEQRHPLA